MNIFVLLAQVILQNNFLSVTNFHLYTSWNKRDEIKFIKLFQNASFYTNVITNDNNGSELIGKNVKSLCSSGSLSRTGIIFDLNSPFNSTFLNAANETRCFSTLYHWLIISTNGNHSKFLQEFSHMDLNVDTEMTYIKIEIIKENAIGVSVYDVYNNGKRRGGLLNVTLDRQFHCEHSSAPLTVEKGPIMCTIKNKTLLSFKTKYENRCSMKDVTIGIATVVTAIPLNTPEQSILDHLFSCNNTHVDTYSRIGFKLQMLLRDSLQFNVRYKHNNLWSTTMYSGGALGNLMAGEADHICSPLLLTSERIRDNLWPALVFDGFRSIFVFRTQQNEGIIGVIFLKPYEKAVWICYGAMILLCSVALKIIFTLEFSIFNSRKMGSKDRSGRNQNLDLSLPFIPSYLSTFLTSLGSACQQGSYTLPTSSGGRIFFISFIFASFLMYNYYTSMVVSSLLGNPIRSEIKTLSRLADSTLEVGSEKIGYTEIYLNISTVPEVRYFVKKRVIPQVRRGNFWVPAKIGAIRARDENFAYHCEASTLYHHIEKNYLPHEICDINEIYLRPDKILAFYMRKDSPYKEISKLKFTWMRESGLLSKHRRYWIKNKLHCFANNIVLSVGLEYTAPLFILLALGIVASFIVCTLENIYFQFDQERKIKF